MIGDAIYNRLTDDATVSGYVGERVYPGWPTNDPTMPQILYDVPDDVDPARSYDGPSGMRTAQVEIECVATRYEIAAALARAVNDSLDAQRGTWGGVVVMGCRVQSIVPDSVTLTDHGEDVLYHVHTVNVSVSYET